MNHITASDVDPSRPYMSQPPSRCTNAQSVHAMQVHVATPCYPEGPLLGRSGPDLRLLFPYEALVLAQHRPRGGIGALLEQGPCCSRVCCSWLCPLQP